ncbi:MAG: bifunctional 5,10-methylenetetrahydrofolate dehydrogenase/5,10-methenyltetrahydrofolate cyclohydrolase [Candidatus Omnitrophica bacterium]|nr:bifunctional 5,10-methylenetetrahydrofolate dehydrogenase/5,10-methenyltetrahydrofolate cyclohydrolase [Candidatus Omnitrophota bacterium]MBU4478925.1 bifunctional 5,10-methylenetetrahydrofolate dehydrogenase/5,10-methenyltetrahydrofolate cyclohydrolase [Candidatus Omnitrophota bacterium]MCG2704384.1 bifunctional 5,10-methylenetetrahydrofolate dehydrogenase/5,10-methenyltetrahydrofolate cyclohydrolase [Candidatus Omnitrophota bacterium]
MEKLLRGTDVAARIQSEVKAAAGAIKQKYGKYPTLCAVQVGDSQEALLYLEFQRKVAQRLSINYLEKKLPAQTTQSSLIGLLEELNNDKKINGIIVQLPLPLHFDTAVIWDCIAPIKDVEGVHPENLGKIVLNQKSFVPCTAYAVMELLSAAKVDLTGKEAVVIGHSRIVGKPLSLMLMNALSTVTVCHIATAERGHLQEHVGRAEVLVVAVGKPNLVKGDWVRPGAVVVDVGINCVGGKVVGDVEFEEAKKRAAFITPVPGGVGPVTVSVLMRNLVEATRLQLGNVKSIIKNCKGTY